MSVRITRYRIPSDVVPGHLEWLRATTGSSSGETFGLATDSGNNVIAVGYYTGSPDFGGGAVPNRTARTIFIAKYNSAGALVSPWPKLMGDNTSSALAVAVDSNDNVIVAGYCNGSIDFGGGGLTGGPLFVAKYTSAGAYLWHKRFTGGVLLEARGGGPPASVAVDSSGNIYLAASIQNSMNFGGIAVTTSGVQDMGMAKLNGTTGATMWAFSRGGDGLETVRSIAVDAAGDIYVAGDYLAVTNNSTNLGGGNQNTSPGGTTTTGGHNVFLAKYLGASGDWVWSYVTGRTGDSYGQSVAVDRRTGSIIFGGGFQGVIDFGHGDIRTFANAGNFLVSYTPAGVWQWNTRWTGKTLKGIAIDSSDTALSRFYITGEAGAIDWLNNGTFQTGNGFYIAHLTQASPTVVPTFVRAIFAQGGNSSAGYCVTFDGLQHMIGGGIYYGTTNFGGISSSGGVGFPNLFVAQYVR